MWSANEMGAPLPAGRRTERGISRRGEVGADTWRGDSGAVPRSATNDLLRLAAGVLVFVLVGVALLYAYRSQTPALQLVPITQAVLDIQNDRVSAVVVDGNTATLTLTDGARERTVVPSGKSDPLADAITSHNRARPERQIQLRYEASVPSPWPVIAGIALSLLPLLSVAALILFAAYAFTRSRRGDVYEQLARIADLRDRGVLTEDEFQREKRRLLH